MVYEAFIDAAMDCIRMLPFLFLAFFLLEALEHKASEKMQSLLAGSGGCGPLVGSLLGVIPQCGFSIMASDFYAAGVISMGSLLAVYLSTSDEALVLLLAEPGRFADIFRLLSCKLIIGAAGGFLVLGLEKRGRLPGRSRKPADLCGEKEKGKTKESIEAHPDEPAYKYILWPALRHTKQVFLYLFLISFLIGLFMEASGEEAIRRVFLEGSLFQPFLACLIGLIPNCAASVMLTRLYLEGVLSFGSAVAGLCSSAGLGLLVLFRVNKDLKDNLRVLGLLLGISFISGTLIQLIL